MDKGYLAADILEQCGRLEQEGIRYSFFYLMGISGAGHGEDGARATAAVCNRLHPTVVGANMLTIYPNSRLPVTAYLPKERDSVASELQHVIDTVSEAEMEEYRRNLKSLG